MPFADLLLLQHGDVLFGAGVSTYSMMIANVVALQALKKGLEDSPIFWDGRKGLQTDLYHKRFDFKCKELK